MQKQVGKIDPESPVTRLYSGKPYWLSLDTKAVKYPRLEANVACDVVVLGSGVSGALAAYHLVAKGVDTILVERDQVAYGSTAASTGLLQYEVDVPLVELCERVGTRRAVHAYWRGLRAIEQLEHLVRTIDSSCGFSRHPSLQATSSNWHRRRLRREYDFRKKLGFDVTFLDRDALREYSSIDRAGAILSQGNAQIDPRRFTSDLIAYSADRGLRVFVESPVKEIEETATGARLRTRQGTLSCRKLIVATGYERISPLIDRVANLNCTYAAVSEPLSGFPGWPDACLYWETGNRYFYCRQVDGRRAMIGGQDTSYASDHKRDRLLQTRVAKLIRQFRQLFPKIHFDVEFSWGGTFAETKDGLPYIGSPPGHPALFYALGYGGNGITYSMIAAELLCDLCLGRSNDDAEVFSFQR